MNKYILAFTPDAFKQNFRNLLEDMEGSVQLSGGPTGEQDVTGDLSLTGKLGVGTTSPGMDIGIEKTVDSAVGIRTQNLSAGTSASANIDIRSDAPRILVAALSSTRALTLYGQAMANWTEVRTVAGSGLAIGTGSNSSPIIFGTASLERARIPAAGGLVIGTAALATTATDGFLYIPTCAGTPTGTPTANAGRVPLVYDSTNNKLYIYSGGAWKSATFA